MQDLVVGIRWWRDQVRDSASTRNDRPAWLSMTAGTLVLLGEHCRERILRISASFNLLRKCMCRELGRGRIAAYVTGQASFVCLVPPFEVR